MSDVTITVLSSGYNLSLINSNLQTIVDSINNDRLQIAGGGNTMKQDLDMNGFSILNTKVDITDSSSLLSVGDADIRYYKKAGDTLLGPMNANGNKVYGLAYPTSSDGAVRKDQLDAETASRIIADSNEASARAKADAALEAQLIGNTPLEASAFSVISWHKQTIEVSVDIPDNVNAWSFGPTITVDTGQVVSVGNGSFWTIANGELDT